MNLDRSLLAPQALCPEDLDAIHGGMFGPFINSPARRPPVPPAPAPVNPVTFRSVAVAVTEGATAGYLGAAAAGFPHQARIPVAAGTGLANGLAHGAGGVVQALPSPGPSPIPANLNVAATSRNPLGPKHYM